MRVVVCARRPDCAWLRPVTSVLRRFSVTRGRLHLGVDQAMRFWTRLGSLFRSDPLTAAVGDSPRGGVPVVGAPGRFYSYTGSSRSPRLAPGTC